MRAILGLAGVGLTASIGLTQSPPSPFPMPGTVVGKPTAVGTPFPRVGGNVGTPIGFNGPDGKPINVNQRPAGQLIDLTNLSAPLAAPLQPGLIEPKPKGTLELLFEKWKAMLGFGKPVQPPGTYIPSLTRRTKERREQAAAWQRN